MATELMTSLSLFKTMLDMAKGLKDMNDATVRNAAVIELQEHIVSAKEAQSTLLDEIRGLKTQMAEMETWEAEKKRYELTDFGGGTFAYRLKETMSGGEPPHRICAHCYEDGHKAILQFRNKSAFQQDIYKCVRCSTQYSFGHKIDRPPLDHSGGDWMAR